MRETGLLDKKRKMIREGDLVSLDGCMTAEDGMGWLPNGYIFDESDIYEVIWDEGIENWSLDLGVKPDSPENRHYMNHAVGLLHSQDSEIKGKEDGRSADDRESAQQDR